MTAEERLALATAEREQAVAQQQVLALIDQALAATVELPELPVECKTRVRSGVRENDRLDVALVKTGDALNRANNTLLRCSGLYDDVRQGLQETRQATPEGTGVSPDE